MKRLTIAVMGLLCANMAWAACNPHIKPTTPSVDFEVHNNGTVTHKPTGLMWKVCEEGTEYQNGSCIADTTCTALKGSTCKFTWAAALNHVRDLNNAGGFAGYTDWRLPNIKELSSIVERSCHLPSLNLAIFPTYFNVSGGVYSYWSSSPNVLYDTQAWAWNITGAWSMGKTGSAVIRLVRTP